MLNNDLKILAKILEDRLQTTLPSMISREHSCSVKSRTKQDSLRMVITIIGKVDGNAVLISLDQSKVIDRMDHGFLEVVLFAAVFGFYFCSWIRLYASLGVVV